MRLPAKAGKIVDGDVAAWALVDRAAEAAGECLCESPCSLAALLGNPKGPISLSEIKNCPSLKAEEFDPRELVECYCLISASLGTVPSLDSIMDTEGIKRWPKRLRLRSNMLLGQRLEEPSRSDSRKC